MCTLTRAFQLIAAFAAHRTLANYVMWNMVMNRVSNLPQKFLDLRTDFNKVPPLLRMFCHDQSAT